MKKALYLIIAAGVGALLEKGANTERGKRIICWTKDKVQKQIKNLTKKVDEVTGTTNSEKETVVTEK